MIGNWIDLVIIFYLLICFFGGLKKGLLLVVINFFCFFAALILAIFFYRYPADFLADNFEISSAYAPLIGFFLSLFIFKIVLSVAAYNFLPKIKFFARIGNSFLNRLLGAATSLVYGGLIVFTILSLILALSLPSSINEHFYSSRVGVFTDSDPLKLNRRFENIFDGVLRNVLKDLNKIEFLTIGTDSSEMHKLDFKAEDLKFSAEDEKEMLKLINEERRARGLVELEADESLREVSRNYAFYMFENSYVAHYDLDGKTPAERLREAGIEFYFSGENLALSANVNSAHKGLMNSLGHRRNILFPFFRKVGIGAVDGGEFGMMFVQNFTD